MVKKKFAGRTVEVTEEGYLTNPSEWTREIAIGIAGEENITLTDEHLAIIEFLRHSQLNGATISIRSINRSGIMDVRTFYRLFPGAPLKKASRIAGLPKPKNCI